MTPSTGEHSEQGADQGPELEIPTDTFAHRLILVRAFRNLTVKEAAEKTGLGYGSWSNWERGSMPRDLLDVVEKISDALRIDPAWLVNGGGLTSTHPRRMRWGVDRPGRNTGGPSAESSFRLASSRPTVRPNDTRPNGHPSVGQTRPGRPSILRPPTAA